MSDDSVQRLAAVLTSLEEISHGRSLSEKMDAIITAQEKLTMSVLMHTAQIAKLREAVALLQANRR